MSPGIKTTPIRSVIARVVSRKVVDNQIVVEVTLAPGATAADVAALNRGPCHPLFISVQP